MIAVDPPYQRRAIATQLMDRSVEHMRERGRDIVAVAGGHEQSACALGADAEECDSARRDEPFELEQFPIEVTDPAGEAAQRELHGPERFMQPGAAPCVTRARPGGPHLPAARNRAANGSRCRRGDLSGGPEGLINAQLGPNAVVVTTTCSKPFAVGAVCERRAACGTSLSR